MKRIVISLLLIVFVGCAPSNALDYVELTIGSSPPEGYFLNAVLDSSIVVYPLQHPGKVLDTIPMRSINKIRIQRTTGSYGALGGIAGLAAGIGIANILPATQQPDVRPVYITLPLIALGVMAGSKLADGMVVLDPADPETINFLKERLEYTHPKD
jgi:hypothetical protein